MLQKRYRLYIDESGDHTYNLLDEPEHRFLALLGVWFESSTDYVAFADALEDMKREIFGPRKDNPVVLHRSDIINRKKAFGVLRDNSLQQSFDDQLCDVIGNAQFNMVCVVIDKRLHLQQNVSPFHPYHTCLAALLDCYCGWLNYHKAIGDVMAEARGAQEDRQLAQAYLRAFESGTFTLSHTHYQRALTTKELKLRKKNENIAGLQLADVLAHPLKCWVLAREAKITWSTSPYAIRLLDVALPKLICHPELGHTEDYGAVMLPK
ncbi:MAG: DUF3800 domain-containing protein [bacterium]